MEPTRGTTCRLRPTAVVVDFSNPLPLSPPPLASPINYTNAVQLIASADSASCPADGDFGNLGQGGLGSTGTGFTVVPARTVTLYSFNGTTWVPTTAGGSGTRLVLTVAEHARGR